MVRRTGIQKVLIITVLLLSVSYVLLFHTKNFQSSYNSLINSSSVTEKTQEEKLSENKLNHPSTESKLPVQTETIEVNSGTAEENYDSKTSNNNLNQHSDTTSKQSNSETDPIVDINNETFNGDNDKNTDNLDNIDNSSNGVTDDTPTTNDDNNDSHNNTDNDDDKYDETDLNITDSNEQEANPKYHEDWDNQKKETMSFIYSDSLHDKTLFKRTFFFSEVFKYIHEYKPSINPLDEYADNEAPSQGSTSNVLPYLTFEELSNHLITSDYAMYNLKFNHDKVVNHLSKEFPHHIYEKGSKGIVYVGGNRFSWLTMLSIMNIRDNGCKLPVEVLIPTYEEYQLTICRDVLPKYNAKCIYLPRLVGNKVFEENSFKGYQYKSLALALSSFEDVILMDADNTPLIDPNELFTNSPFTETGLVFWPDFWKRTTSPKFYEIVGANIDFDKRRDFGYTEYGKKFSEVCPEDITLYHHFEGTLPGPTSESGQVVISKRKHFRSIILSLYYNTHGPEFYYPLLSQGAAGQGDKETFIAAAYALGEDYYAVKKRLISLGRYKDNNFQAFAMGQFNPIQDYKLYSEYADKDVEVKEKPDLFMVHANRPKMDPWKLFKEEAIIDHNTGERNRMYGENFIDQAKYDFELRAWTNMRKLLCEDKLTFITFQNHGVTSEEVCEEVKKQLEYLKQTTRDLKV